VNSYVVDVMKECCWSIWIVICRSNRKVTK